MSKVSPPLPTGACDAHMHLYAPGPHLRETPFAGPDARLDQYRALMGRLGISRVVLVQSMLYGTDNDVMLGGLAALGPQVARGVAVTRADAPSRLWDDLASSGVCGVRAFMLPGGIYAWDELPRLAARLADRGWQMHLQMDGREIAAREAFLSDLPCSLVVDHVGKFIEPVSSNHPAFVALLRLVNAGRVWIKLSGLYETSRSGAPSYSDVAVLARRLVAEAPDRMLWASNWPHPNAREPVDDTALVRLASSLSANAETRWRMFVGNAAKLFGFAERTVAA